MSNEMTLATGSLPDATFLEMRMDSQKYPRLYTYGKPEATFEMSKIVTRAFLYRGQAADPNNIQFISSTLVDELLQEEKWGAKFLSFQEIGLIVKQAVLGSSEMYGISVASLYKAILDWIKSDGTRLQNEAAERKRQKDADSLRNSIIAPMIDAFSNQFAKEHKIK